MKIVALGGSPKGKISVTLQYVLFLQKVLPGHEFEIVQISSRIRKLEKDESTFTEVIEKVRSADLVLWAFPLYVFLVPSQYKRFIELIYERNAQDAFSGKAAAVLTTSIHFFDHTAHSFMHAVCDDLGMNFVGSYSPEMHDLQKAEGQEKTRQFGNNIVQNVQKEYLLPRRFSPLNPVEYKYVPGVVEAPVETQGKKVVILHDLQEGQDNLKGMIERMQASFSGEVQAYNMHDVNITAGCQGCLKCGQNYECVFTGRDEYIEFYNDKLRQADILIYAGTITDRFLSSRWKMFWDRGFFNCHTPSLVEKQFGFVISGPLGQIDNLRDIFEAYVQWQQSNLVDIVTDEVADSGLVDAQLTGMADRLVSNSLQGYIEPMMFPGVGGYKIFRDDIFSKLRYVFQADHRYFSRNGLYDFPQKKVGLRIMNSFIGLIFRVPRIRREFDKVVTRKMVEPFQKVVDSTDS